MKKITDEILSNITEAVFTQFCALVNKFSWRTDVSTWLAQKTTRNAYKRALSATFTAFVRRYGDLIITLLDDDVLTSREFTRELSKLFISTDIPDPSVIIGIWEQQYSEPSEINFKEVLNYFFKILASELILQSPFKVFLDQRNWEELPDNPSNNTTVLNETVQLIEESNRLLAIPNRHINYENSVQDARGVVIGENNTIYQYFLSDDRFYNLMDKLYDFSLLITEKTQDFVGRQFVFDKINHFISTNESGYFTIQGEPGIGKTALSARLVQMNNYVHHFNVASQGIFGTEQFLENVCVQLIAKYNLESIFDLSRARRDSGFLSQLLQESANKLVCNEKLVLVVDALDEASQPLMPQVNVLYLPSYLPKGVFFIVTTRPIKDNPLQTNTPQEILYLEGNSEENLTDIQAYLEKFAQKKEVRLILRDNGITMDYFVKIMLDKSEGNFMYLHYVLPEIIKGKYQKFKIDKLPQGLMGYYETHWRELRIKDEDLWIKYRQPILCFLSAVNEPISVNTLSEISRCSSIRVKSALVDWWKFLDKEVVHGEERYRIYHASFRDFLRKKDEVGEIDLVKTNSDIADVLLEQWQSMR